MPPTQKIVLCVDDDPDDQLLVQETIMEIDPTVGVVTALNGNEAMEFLYQAKQIDQLPCLVIMDINMPVLNGKETLSQIKKDKDFDEVPVVIFTTSSNPSDQLFCNQLGASLVIKPVNIRDLQSTVRRLLNYCET